MSHLTLKILKCVTWLCSAFVFTMCVDLRKQNQFVMYCSINYIGSEFMNFLFIQYLWNELCVFISLNLWKGDIKHKSFINTVWNDKILFITCETRKNVRKIQIEWNELCLQIRQRLFVSSDALTVSYFLNTEMIKKIMVVKYFICINISLVSNAILCRK